MTNRQLHRWLSLVGILFFLIVTSTGIWLQIDAIFGEDEAAHEAMATAASLASLSKPLHINGAAFDGARQMIFAKYGNRSIGAIEWILKAPTPALVFHLDGDAPLKVTVNAATSAILKAEPDGESWVKRLHSGEILGDGGKFLGLAWGLALMIMSITGAILYWQMQRKRQAGSAAKGKGWRQFFW